MAIYTLKEMMKLKKEHGCSSQLIADLSDVPLGTVQKIFCGITSTPRRSTLIKLSKAFDILDLNSDNYNKEPSDNELSKSDMVAERSSYGTVKGSNALNIDSYDNKTIEDYLALPEGTRIELIDGKFYDMAAPTFVHQRIGGLLLNEFERFIENNGGPCVPSIAPTDVQLDNDDKTMVQPDVLVVCDRKKITYERVKGAPDLIVEVLSPSNWYMDTVRKLKKYKKAGVREYWIVIPDEKMVMVYEFEKSSEAIEYSFDDTIPVGIWNGECKVDFSKIYDKISFLFENRQHTLL